MQTGRAGRALVAGAAGADDALDLADGVGAAVDGQKRRRLGQVDRGYGALHLGCDADAVARSVLAARRDRVFAVWPLRAVVALSVPGEGNVAAGAGGIFAGEHSLAAGIGNRNIDVCAAGYVEVPGRRRT